jgi:hypothetical protein
VEGVADNRVAVVVGMAVQDTLVEDTLVEDTLAEDIPVQDNPVAGILEAGACSRAPFPGTTPSEEVPLRSQIALMCLFRKLLSRLDNNSSNRS